MTLPVSALNLLLDLPESVAVHTVSCADGDSYSLLVQGHVTVKPLTCGRRHCCGKHKRHCRRMRVMKAIPHGRTRITLELSFWQYRCLEDNHTFMAAPAVVSDRQRGTLGLHEFVEWQLHQFGFADTARITQLGPDAVRRIFGRYVNRTKDALAPYAPRVLGVDEVYLGHTLRIVLVDLTPGNRCLIDLLPAKDMEMLRQSLCALVRTGAIERVVVDFDRGFEAAWRDVLVTSTDVKIIIDRWHVIRLATDAVHALRKRLQNQRDDRFLDGGLALLTKRERKLTSEERRLLAEWGRTYPELWEAYWFKERFAGLFDVRTAEEAATQYNTWEAEVRANARMVEVFRTVLNTVGARLDQVLGFFEERLTAGFTEALNGRLRRLYDEGYGWTADGFETFRRLALLHFGRCRWEDLRPVAPQRAVTFGTEPEPL